MKELLDKDLIHNNKIDKIKDNHTEQAVSNLIMDLRHGEIKEKRNTRIKETSKLLMNSGKAKINQEIVKDQLKETILINHEIKKCEKLFEISNRRTDKIIANIKCSSKDKSRKREILPNLQESNEKLFNDTFYVKIEEMRRDTERDNKNIMSNSYSESIFIRENTNTLSKNNSALVTSQTEKYNNTEKNLESLDEIKKILDSIDLEQNFETRECDSCSLETGKEENIKINLIVKSKNSDQNGQKLFSSEEDSADVVQRELINENSENVNLICKFETEEIYKFEDDENKDEIYKLKGKPRHIIKANIGDNIKKIDESKKKKVKKKDSKALKYNEILKDFSNSEKNTDKLTIDLSIKNGIKEMEDLLEQIDKDNVNNSKSEKLIHDSNGKKEIILMSNIIKTSLFPFSKENYLMKKFWEKWRKNMSKSYSNEDLKDQRNFVDSKFDNFLSNLQKRIADKKNNNNTVPEQLDIKRKETRKVINKSEQFKNRFKAQKEIIEKQRLILEEQRIKINKLEEENKPNVSNKVYKHSATNLKSNCKSEDKFKTQFKESKFVENMNKRAEERKVKWEKLKELRMMKEEEKIKMKLLEEENLKKQREQKKYEEIKAEQMEYLKRILEGEERKQELKTIHEAEIKIRDIYKRILLTHYTELWKKILAKKKQLLKEADGFYEKKIKKKCLNSLLNHAKMRKQEKFKLDQLMKVNKLQKKYWTIWYQRWKERMQTIQVADDYNDIRLKRRAIISLLWNKQQNKTLEYELYLEAIQFHKRKLLSKAFQSLKNYSKIMFEEREKEKRLRFWEEKVKEILPDFSIS